MDAYESRVRDLEAEGCTRSDAQAVADAEGLCSRCGGPGAAGAAGLCAECDAEADREERRQMREWRKDSGV